MTHTRIFATALLAAVLATPAVTPAQSNGERALRAAMETETVKGDLRAAIEQYRTIANGRDRGLAARALVRMAECHEKLGNTEAQAIYQRIVRDFADQTDAVAAARTRMARAVTASATQTKQTSVWSGPGVDGMGSPSPDGRYLSFTDWETGDLALRDLTTATNRRLTNTGGWLSSGDYSERSVISPDGRQVAYTWYTDKERVYDVRVLSLGGDNPRPRIVAPVERGGFTSTAAWMPDGRQLVVTRELPNGNEIGLLSVQDGAYRALKTLGMRDPEFVSVSPDGRYIVYDAPAGDNNGPRDVALLSVDGGRESALIAGPSHDSSPLWSADGGRVLFLSNRTGTTALWAVPVANGAASGAPFLVRADVGAMTPLGVTRNGALYYVRAGAVRQNIFTVELDNMAATKAPTLLVEKFVNANISPALSADGQYLAYLSNRNVAGQPPLLVIRNERTGEERTLPTPPGLVTFFFLGPKWFPDNRSVLVELRDPKGQGYTFHRISTDTGASEPVWSTSLGASSYVISPDGRYIYWTVQGTPGVVAPSGRVMRVDLQTREETALRTNEWFIALSLSPDGSRLATLKSVRTDTKEYPGVIEIIPAGGGTPREVYRDAAWLDGSRYNTLSWSSDGRSLLFVRAGTSDTIPSTVWWVPVAGGTAQRVGVSMPGRLKSPIVHPDGRHLIFGVSDASDREIWALENFLPAR